MTDEQSNGKDRFVWESADLEEVPDPPQPVQEDANDTILIVDEDGNEIE